MQVRSILLLSTFLYLIGYSISLSAENDDQNNTQNPILKRSIDIDQSSLEKILASRSFLNKNSEPINDLKKRNDGVKTENILLREKIHELADNLLKLTPSLNKLRNKPFYQSDLGSILNTENDLEEQEIIKKSQALGLNTQITGSTRKTSKTISFTTISTKAASTKEPKISEESSEKDREEDDNDDEEEEDENEIKEETKSVAKQEKKKLKKKQQKKITKESNEDSDDNKDENSKLTSKQLKQVYKFLRKKEKDDKKEEPNSANNLLNSIMSSPNHDIHLKLRDSLSAKAANDELLNWHSKAPFASLNELEEMYQKFYEFYYDYFDIYSGHGSQVGNFGLHHHHHHRHHPHHDHHHLNLLDFLTSKTEKSENKNLKNSLFDKIISSNYLAKHNPWNDYHHVHNIPDYHHQHSGINFAQDPYYLKLKSKINYYLSKDLSPPGYLLREFNQLKYEKEHFEHVNDYDLDYHHMDNYENHFNNPYPHHHYHYSQHPVYDEYGRKLIYTTGQMERFPSSSPNLQLNENLPRQPIVCMNYPDHSSEGFKSFISVESCNQPSFLGSNGVPLFGNGCIFRYICELGYQPIGGASSSIKCNNGFWTARAVCIKQNVNPSSINSNQANNLNRQLQSSPQTLMQSPNFQNSLLKRSDSIQNGIESNTEVKNRAKRENFAENYVDEKNVNSMFENFIDNSKNSVESNELEFNSTENTNERRKDILNKLLEKEKTTLSIKESTVPTTNKLKEIKTTTKETNLKKLIENKEKQIQMNLDPTINWSSIIDSDSEKTIYESFYELLENSGNKLNSNIEFFDINKI